MIFIIFVLGFILFNFFFIKSIFAFNRCINNIDNFLNESNRLDQDDLVKRAKSLNENNETEWMKSMMNKY